MDCLLKGRCLGMAMISTAKQLHREQSGNAWKVLISNAHSFDQYTHYTTILSKFNRILNGMLQTFGKSRNKTVTEAAA